MKINSKNFAKKSHYMNHSIQNFLSSNSSRWKDSPILLALWYDGQGDWKSAHDQVDQLPGESAARIHAYLHRKEGDQWNADYWYSKAGEKRPDLSLEEEWETLVLRFLIWGDQGHRFGTPDFRKQLARYGVLEYFSKYSVLVPGELKREKPMWLGKLCY